MRAVSTTIIFSSLCIESTAYVLPSTRSTSSSLTGMHAFWRHFIPRDEQLNLIDCTVTPRVDRVTSPLVISLLGFTLALPLAANAVSGGGLDFANIDITGQDFSKGNYKGKDFTQVIAKGTNFAGSNLQGCRFYKAFLVSQNTGFKFRGY